ncbi:MAG: helix-turn-helix domain-containing protein, partial [Thermodesulfovibrionales bacterium]|nr:helix-turn-helix domain-containing protein [Thermodesulfovibrionales bacterium]
MAEKIGTRIRLLRNALKKTLSDFAKELNMSVSYLSEVENNKTTLSQDNLLLIMSKFAVNPNWLFYGEGEMFKGDI